MSYILANIKEVRNMTKIGLIIFKIVKRLVLAFCFIYGFDLIVSGMNIFIPINIITLGIVTLLGFPGLLSLIGVLFILM